MTPYTHGGDVLTARARFGGDVLDCSANLNPLGTVSYTHLTLPTILLV